MTEFFHSIQGESTFAGWPCFFIRLTGCHLRCSYCDTEYAFFGGQRETVESCVERVLANGCQLVEVTGGEPLLQKAAFALLEELCDRGLTVLLETSGAVPIEGVDPRVRRIIDVKTPSSGMERHNIRDLERQLRPGDEIKFVVGGRDDYDWARSWLAARPEVGVRRVPVHFSPAHGVLAANELAAWILADGLSVRLGPQLHKTIWPDAPHGV